MEGCTVLDDGEEVGGMMGGANAKFPPTYHGLHYIHSTG